MPNESMQKMFVQWLNHALADAGWRALIRTLMRPYELPVIQLEPESQGQGNTAPAARGDSL
jgi:hypothetical protein